MRGLWGKEMYCICEYVGYIFVPIYVCDFCYISFNEYIYLIYMMYACMAVFFYFIYSIYYIGVIRNIIKIELGGI